MRAWRKINNVYLSFGLRTAEKSPSEWIHQWNCIAHSRMGNVRSWNTLNLPQIQTRRETQMHAEIPDLLWFISSALLMLCVAQKRSPWAMTCGQQVWCCLPGNRVTADRKQISQPYQTQCISWWLCPVPVVSQGRQFLGVTALHCAKSKGTAVPACWAQCSKDRRSDTWLRKVMTIHAVADPQGIFPFFYNFFSASIITQH